MMISLLFWVAQVVRAATQQVVVDQHVAEIQSAQANLLQSLDPALVNIYTLIGVFLVVAFVVFLGSIVYFRRRDDKKG